MNMWEDTMIFNVVVIITRLAPSSFTNATTLLRSPNFLHKVFICSAIVALSIFNSEQPNHDMTRLPQCIYKWNYKNKSVIFAPYDIHKSKVVVHVIHSASFGFTHFSMVLVNMLSNTSYTNWFLDGNTTFPHCHNTMRFNHTSSTIDRGQWPLVM